MNLLPIRSGVFLSVCTEWNLSDYTAVIYLLQSTLKEFDEICPNKVKENILICYREGNPECCRVDSNTIIICLSAKENYWAQYIYQFSHEYCHALIGGDLSGHLIGGFWFEECICTMASFYGINSVAAQWRIEYNLHCRFKNFIPSLNSYFEDNVASIENVEITTWLPKMLSRLEQPKYERHLYNILGKYLFSAFSKDPQLWSILPYIRRKDRPYSSFDSFFISINNSLPPLSQNSFINLSRSLGVSGLHGGL